MEELLRNFVSHLNNNFSNKLAIEVNSFISNINFDNLPSESFPEIENQIKNIISNYFLKSDDKEYNAISKNLYYSYIDEDDKNLINGVKFLIKFYSKFESLNLKKKFYKWRIKSLSNVQNFTPNHFREASQIYVEQERLNNLKSTDFEKTNQNNMSSSNISLSKNKTKSHKNSKPEIPNLKKVNSTKNLKNDNNYDIKISQNSLIYPIPNNNTPSNITNKNSRSKSKQNTDIFDRLYMDSFKKRDDVLLNDEIKQASEMDNCTFVPNIIKKKK